MVPPTKSQGISVVPVEAMLTRGAAVNKTSPGRMSAVSISMVPSTIQLLWFNG